MKRKTAANKANPLPGKNRNTGAATGNRQDSNTAANSTGKKRENSGRTARLRSKPHTETYPNELSMTGNMPNCTAHPTASAESGFFRTGALRKIPAVPRSKAGASATMDRYAAMDN